MTKFEIQINVPMFESSNDETESLAWFRHWNTGYSNLIRVSNFVIRILTVDCFAVLLASIAKSLADFCYPPLCTLCGAAGEKPPLCENCVADLDRLATAAACDLCGYPLVGAFDPCPHCHEKGIAPIDFVVRLGVFSDPLRTLVHRIKYRHGWPLAEYLADRLVTHEPAQGLLTETDCLVAIPLHPTRQWTRGYNQASVIADRVGKICNIPRRSPLVRLRNTQTQTNIRAQAKRVENLRGAFGLIDGDCVSGQHVVLVDDVMTSGATVLSAARTLKAAEPASISVLAVAVADPKGRSYEFI
jgi:ComF family protein